ncbi:MAG: hypothetical protein JWL74_678 [Alphaproteobacteria bacterium]|jgi:hypothetical protein|nr:hypothetical protein [Alphaproteobacteria bacterium]
MAGAYALPVVEGVTIGRTVSLDPRAWQRYGDETYFALDQWELPITAQGLIRLDDGTLVHRFYTDEEVMLQAMSRSPDGRDAYDFTLYQPWSSNQPIDGQQSAFFIDRMRRAWWQEIDMPAYRRFWFEGDDLDQPPLRLIEDVFEDHSGRPVRQVSQVCMLYSRPLPPDGAELLLALDIQGGTLGYGSQEIMIGVPLTPAQFNA